MTFEQMRDIAKERMNKQISYLSRNEITFDELLASLSAYYSVGLFTDVEYLDFLLRIRHAELNRVKS